MRLMPAFWMLCVLVFSGCQSVPPDVSPGALAIASEWKLTGKLGVKTPERSGNFAFDWQQTGEQFDIALRGPLGMQIAHIYGHQQRSYLDIPDQQGLQATSPDELAALALGYSLPVSPMRYWVRGIPDPRQRAASRVAPDEASPGRPRASREWPPS